MHIPGDQPTEANTRDRGGCGRETGGVDEVGTDRGSAVMSDGRRGQAALSEMAMHTKAGCVLVTGLKGGGRAARGTKNIIRICSAVGAAFEDVHRSEGTGADSIRGNVIGVWEVVCFRAALLGSGQGEAGEKSALALAPLQYSRVYVYTDKTSCPRWTRGLRSPILVICYKIL